MISDNAMAVIKMHLRTGKMPSTRWLANKLNVTTETAQQILTEYRIKMDAGEAPGLGPVPPEPMEEFAKKVTIEQPILKVFEDPRDQPRQAPVNTEVVREALGKHKPEPAVKESQESHEPLVKEPAILTIIRQYALYMGMLIDLVLGIVFFLAVSVDEVTAAGMVAMAFIAVLFKVVAFVDGKKWLWAIFMSTTWWASVSFAVTTIGAQSEASSSLVSQDAGEMARLQQKVVDATENLKKKNEALDLVPTGYRSELAVRQEAVRQAEGQLQDAEAKLEAFKHPVQTEMKRLKGITAENAFVAIPHIVMEGSLSQRISLIFFSLLFFALEYTIAWSAVPRKKK